MYICANEVNSKICTISLFSQFNDRQIWTGVGKVNYTPPEKNTLENFNLKFRLGPTT